MNQRRKPHRHGPRTAEHRRRQQAHKLRTDPPRSVPPKTHKPDAGEGVLAGLWRFIRYGSGKR
jgi:hypothetical protein